MTRLFRTEDEARAALKEFMDRMPGKGITYSGIWSDGHEILCKTYEQAEGVADVLSMIFFDSSSDVHTGYYDPKEDCQSGEIDDHTGWYYVNFD